MVTSEEVLDLLVRHIAAVMAIDASRVTADARFDEDLHADSLDLVEVVEAVERELRSRGTRAGLSDQELVALRTVGQAAERIATSTDGTGDTRAR